MSLFSERLQASTHLQEHYDLIYSKFLYFLTFFFCWFKSERGGGQFQHPYIFLYREANLNYFKSV